MSIEKIIRKKGVVYKVWYRDDGQRLRSRTFDLRKDAVAYEADVRLKKRRGHLADIDAGRQTFDELCATWWAQYAEQHHAPKTLQTNRRLLDRHILPLLGPVPLAKIRPHLVEEFAANLHRAGVG